MSEVAEDERKSTDEVQETQDDELIESTEQLNINQDGDEDSNFHECKEVVDNNREFVYEKDLAKAVAAKEEGNAFFRNKEYDEALEAYSRAITYCPEDDKENLSTFYGNRSAAYFALEEWELVVEDCTAAIEMKPDYVKVLARRMLANEKLEKYEEALRDAKLVQDNDPSYPKISDKIRRLQIQYDDKMAKLKDEALGKLKELGNSILGNFGMSLDNFKMTQDPNTGSWNISMGNGK